MFSTRMTVATLALIGFSGCSPDANPVAPTCSNPAPLLSGENASTRVPGRYIVGLKEGADANVTAQQLADKHGFTVRHVFKYVPLGFSAEMTDAALAAVRCEPVVERVDYVIWGTVAG